MQYIQVSIPTNDHQLQEILIAFLAEIGYDGFESTESVLQAYITKDMFDVTRLQTFLQPYNLNYTKNIIPKQNWNAVWESNFDPVVVDDFVGIRAHFHPSIQNVAIELVITPKMSFGTGHHATTFTVMQLMRALNFQNKSVFDFGTGTGVLAILAEKLGARSVFAIDNDEWCIENASENLSINQCTVTRVALVDTAAQNKSYDIVLANINKNIILDNLHHLDTACNEGGDIILSGFLAEDELSIMQATSKLGWKHVLTKQKAQWIAIQLKK